MVAATELGTRPTSFLDAPLGTAERPSWRGRSHQVALLAAIPVLAIMLVAADGARALVGISIYAVGLSSMLLASTTYHRWVHTLRWRAIWRRADHAMIFVAIAGSCTPLCLSVLGTPAAIVALALMWTAAIVGVTIKLTGWTRADPVARAMYIANGWAGVVLIPALARAGYVLPLVLLVVGGVVYTVGALGFSRRWPTLRPAVFSYHEVWHLFTLAAAGVHLAAVWLVAV